LKAGQGGAGRAGKRRRRAVTPALCFNPPSPPPLSPHPSPSARLVRPVPGSSLLEADAEGLALLRALPPGAPVAPVVVIGPYRSGKSFLLNQLLGVGCASGFGVGHTRSTQTRGVWMWSEPVERAAFLASAGRPGSGGEGPPGDDPAASTTTSTPATAPRLLFIDTEGFESAGQADAYDDRIFALATVLSSVLVYNLPEALRESDVEKLSFAAQLADALYDGSSAGGGAGATDPAPTNAVAPGAMVWLIQRDFLGGPSAQEALDAALAPVPNPGGDAGIAAVNGVRAALRVVARTSTAASLAQPHLDRTALCELGDAALAPAYRAGRERLKTLVGGLAAPKRIGGKVLDGPGLADLVEQLVGALNAREVPSAGAILAHFNRDLGHTVVGEYEAALRAVPLPAPEAGLEAAHVAAQAAALAHFARARFGRAGGGWGGQGGGGSEKKGKAGGDAAGGASPDPLASALAADIATAWSAARDRNELASSRSCSALAATCEDGMEAEGRAALPSMGRFAARYAACRSAFEAGCVGPAAPDASARLDRAHDRELGRFTASYNDRLASALTGGALAAIVAGRFLFRAGLLEGCGWAAFAVLQLYPRARWGPGGSMYETRWWSGGVVRGWEAVARFPAVWVLAGVGVALLVLVRCGRRVRARRAAAARRRRGGSGKGGDDALAAVDRPRRPPGRPAASIASRLLYGASARPAAADRDLEV